MCLPHWKLLSFVHVWCIHALKLEHVVDCSNKAKHASRSVICLQHMCQPPPPPITWLLNVPDVSQTQNRAEDCHEGLPKFEFVASFGWVPCLLREMWKIKRRCNPSHPHFLHFIFQPWEVCSSGHVSVQTWGLVWLCSFCCSWTVELPRIERNNKASDWILQLRQGFHVRCWAARTWPFSTQRCFSAALLSAPLLRSCTSCWETAALWSTPVWIWKETKLHSLRWRSQQPREDRIGAWWPLEEEQESAMRSGWRQSVSNNIFTHLHQVWLLPVSSKDSCSKNLVFAAPASGTRVIPDPSPPVAFEGSRIVLSCNASRGSHLSYTWFFNSREVPPSTAAYLIHGNEIIIERATPEHAGGYYCTAWSTVQNTRRFSTSTEVQVTIKGEYCIDVPPSDKWVGNISPGSAALPTTSRTR